MIEAYNVNIVYIETSMSIQIDLHDHHSNNFIRELEKMHSRSCDHLQKIKPQK